MKIVVTGSAGYVGSYLIKKLLEDEKFADYEIVGVDNFLVGKEENHKLIGENKRLKLLKGDICDKEFVKWLLKDTEIVYHLAAISGVVQCSKMPHLAMKVNIGGTLNLLESSVTHKIKKFIFFSSAAVYGEPEKMPISEDFPTLPKSPYAITKLCGENFCEYFRHQFGLNTVILRLFNAYGPRQSLHSAYAAAIPAFITSVMNEKPITIFGTGYQTRDFIYVKDVSNAALFVAMKEDSKGIYNIGTGQAVSIIELSKLIMSLMKKEVEQSFLPPRPGDILHSTADISKITKLGFKPTTKLADGLQETIKYFIHNS